MRKEIEKQINKQIALPEAARIFAFHQAEAEKMKAVVIRAIEAQVDFEKLPRPRMEHVSQPEFNQSEGFLIIPSGRDDFDIGEVEKVIDEDDDFHLKMKDGSTLGNEQWSLGERSYLSLDDDQKLQLCLYLAGNPEIMSRYLKEE